MQGRLGAPSLVYIQRAEVIREVQEAIAGEDTVEWARRATGSYITYPYLMELLDEMIEED